MEQRRIYSLLNQAVDKKDLLSGCKLHCQIIQEGLQIDPILPSYLIRAYAACGCLLEANQVFLQAKSLSVFTWSAIISAYAKIGHGQNAIELFNEMNRTGIEPDKHVLLAVLKGCSSVLDVEFGRLIHFSILFNGLEADLSLSNCLIDTYSKAKNFSDARKVFDEQITKDVVSWSSLMIGYAEHQIGYDVLVLYNQMQQEGIDTNRVTIISILKACLSINDLAHVESVHVYILEKGFYSDRVVCNTLIDVYAKCGSIKHAHGVFVKLLNQDIVSWNAIIAAYTFHGHGQNSLGLFQQMLKQNIKPDKFTIVSLLKTCSSIGALKDGKLVFTYYVELGLEFDRFISNALVDMYAKCGDLQEAHRLFDELPERSVVTWSAIIAGHVLNSQPHKAFEVFLQMQKEKKKPDSYTYGSILKACSNIKSLNMGKLLHEHIVENYTEIDLVVGSALVDMYIKCESLDDARLLFDNLPKRDVVTWSAIITGYVELGSVDEALGLFQQMLQHRITPNAVTFVSCLKACSSIAALSEGTLIHGQIIESCLELDKSICNTLIDMYSKCGCLGDAYKMFMNVLNKDAVSWNALIAGFALQSEYELALHYFQNMQKEGFMPDDLTFLSLLSACNHLGLVDQGRQHFDSMAKVFGIVPKIEHYNCMIDLLGRTGNLKEAQDLLKLVPFETSHFGRISLLSNCSNHGDPNVAKNDTIQNLYAVNIM